MQKIYCQGLEEIVEELKKPISLKDKAVSIAHLKGKHALASSSKNSVFVALSLPYQATVIRRLTMKDQVSIQFLSKLHGIIHQFIRLHHTELAAT